MKYNIHNVKYILLETIIVSSYRTVKSWSLGVLLTVITLMEQLNLMQG